jgi:hypothetical protein
VDKPTCTTNKFGDKTWKLPNGEIHREDGPAIEWNIFSSPVPYKEWWLNNKAYSSKEDYFEDSTEENKEKLLYSAEFMSG